MEGWRSKLEEFKRLEIEQLKKLTESQVQASNFSYL